MCLFLCDNVMWATRIRHELSSGARGQVVRANGLCCCFGRVFYCLDNRCHTKTTVSADGGDKWQPRGRKIFLPSPLSVSPDKITASILKPNRHHSVVSLQIFLDEHPLGELSHSEHNQTMRVSSEPSPQNTIRAFCFSKAWYISLCTVHTF